MIFSILTYNILLKSATGLQFLETFLWCFPLYMHMDTVIKCKSFTCKIRDTKIYNNILFFRSFNVIQL